MSERPQWKLALDAVVPSGKLLYRLAGDDRVPRPTRVLALAEATRGAGVGHRMVLVVTVGTGIGGGLVIDGRIERGRCHLGEIGHMTVDPAGPH